MSILNYSPFYLESIVSVVIIPLAGLVGTIMIRKEKNLPATCSSDLILLLIVFDAGVLINLDSLNIFIHEDLQIYTKGVYSTFIVFGLITLLFTILHVEGKVTDHYYLETLANDERLKFYTIDLSRKGFPYGFWGAGWLISLILVGLHIYFFIYE